MPGELKSKSKLTFAFETNIFQILKQIYFGFSTNIFPNNYQYQWNFVLFGAVVDVLDLVVVVGFGGGGGYGGGTSGG